VVTIGWRNERFAADFAATLTCAAEDARAAPDLVVVANGPEGEAAADTVVEVGRDLSPKLVRLDRNKGFSGGANAGLAEARGDILVVANLDVTFDRGFLSALRAEAGEPGWDFVAPRVTQGPNGLEAGVARRKPSHRLAWVTPPPVRAGPIPAGNGCCLILRRAALDLRRAAAGALFDDEYHSFNEDIDLFWWAQRAGLVVRYAPAVSVCHALAGSFDGAHRFEARPDDVQRRVMANYRVTVWRNASAPVDWLGWPVGELGYLAQALRGRGMAGARAYAASWPTAVATARAIRRRRGRLRPRVMRSS
jgi:GT2 family glycosyltransferase